MSNILFEKQKSVAIDINSSGDNTIISAPTNGYIVIDHVNLLPTSAVTVKFKSGASTERAGPYPLDSKQAFTIENPSDWQDGIIRVDNGDAFVINLSGAVQVGGYIRYRIIGE